MTNKNTKNEFEIVSDIVSLLKDIKKEKQTHILNTLATWLEIGSTNGSFRVESMPTPAKSSRVSSKSATLRFSDHKEMSPKQFMLEKKPHTEVERITCLAYYLTHYRNIPHFKTLDLSKLNTEAAQQKFSNAPQAAKNAAKSGLLVPAIGGKRQVSGVGEQFIQALPGQEEAKNVLHHLKKPRRKKRTKTKRKL